MNSHELEIPDLLRRFVPAPYKVDICCENTRLAVQTNDLNILSELEHTGNVADKAGSGSPLLIKIIRDADAPIELSDIEVVSCGPVATLTAGAGTVLLVDGERNEILGFLAPSISAREFVRELLPILLKLFHDIGAHVDSKLAFT